MKIGCPKEIKDKEYRVGLTPATVAAYVDQGHEVFIQQGAGKGSGISDEDYTQSGGKILNSAQAVWSESEMIVKVKEPLPQEFDFMKPKQIIYTYFHFAADKDLTFACIEKKNHCYCL